MPAQPVKTVAGINNECKKTADEVLRILNSLPDQDSVIKDSIETLTRVRDNMQTLNQDDFNEAYRVMIQLWAKARQN